MNAANTPPATGEAAPPVRDVTPRQLASLCGLMLAIVLGAFVRFFPALGSDFPLNDGGLFYLMTQELQRAHYVLPLYTDYNAAQIPFAYPPLPFYLAGCINDLMGLALIDVIHYLPPLLTTLEIPAFYLLARALLSSWIQAIFATFAFAMLPNTFGWLIMGGGLTRAPGFVFSILTVYQAYLLYTRSEKRSILWMIVCASLTALCHPVVTWAAVYSTALLFLCFGRSRKGVIHSLLVAAGVAVVTAPWWATVVSRHGLGTFLAATRTRHELALPGASLLTFKFSGEPLMTLLAVIGLFGIFVCLSDRKFFLPLWLVTIFMLQERGAAQYAALPLALLAGIGLDRVLLPGLYQASQEQRPLAAGAQIEDRAADDGENSLPPYLSGRIPRAALVYCLLYSLVTTFMIAMSAPELNVVSGEERTAMQWLAANAPRDSKFLVLTGRSVEEDSTSEWFPVLAQRVSLATVQGYEWLPGVDFTRRWERHKALQACSGDDASCLERWAQQTGATFTHVYIRKAHNKAGDARGTADKGSTKWLLRSLRSTAAYVPLYENKDVLIFKASQQ